MAEIAPESKRRRMSRRVRWISGISVGIVLAGGGFATAATQMHLWGGGGAKITGQSACYVKHSADVDQELIPIVLHGEDPIQRCKHEWEAGNVVPGVHHAPPLVNCQNGHGIVAAFPGKEGSCGEMGLKPPRHVSPAERARTQAIAKLSTDLEKRFRTCVHKREGVQYVQQRLAAVGLKGWKVSTSDFSRHATCTTFGLNEQKNEVYLIGMKAP